MKHGTRTCHDGTPGTFIKHAPHTDGSGASHHPTQATKTFDHARDAKNSDHGTSADQHPATNTGIKAVV